MSMHVDENALAALRYDITLGATPTGWIAAGDRKARLERVDGHLRPARGAVAQALADDGIGDAARHRVDALEAAVVNRPSAGRSNWSKPFQLRLIAAAGFTVPDTLVTTDPAGRARVSRRARARRLQVDQRRAQHRRHARARRRPSASTGVATGPVQFQRWIDGSDVRVHVVGDRWFATAVDSAADDYRYAARDGADVAMAPLEIPNDARPSAWWRSRGGWGCSFPASTFA